MRVTERPHSRPLLSKTAVSGAWGDGLIRGPAGRPSCVGRVCLYCGDPFPPIRAGSLTNLELPSCKISKHPSVALLAQWRGSALQGVQVFQLMRAVQDHAVNVRPAAHADCSCGALVKCRQSGTNAGPRAKATVGDRLVLSPLGI
jgi:hypothetical protein